MSERFDQTDHDLGAALQALGAQLRYPATPDLAGAVRRQIESGRPARRSLLAFPHRWLVATAVLALLVIGATLAYPGTRSAVADWFDIPGVTLFEDDSRPLPALGAPLDLGEPVTLEEAQGEVSFRILVPALGWLGEPDEVYLDEQPVGGAVTFVYDADEELETTKEVGVGILLTQFQGSLNPGIYGKGTPAGVDVERIEVNGEDALWISGAPHTVWFFDADEEVIQDTLRYAGNTLLWQDGNLTLRLESALDRETVLEIAASMREGG